MLNDYILSHLVSLPFLSSSACLLIIFLCTQHGDYSCLVMETSQAATSIPLESIRYSHAVCDKHLRHQLLRGKVSVQSERFTPWYSL